VSPPKHSGPLRGLGPALKKLRERVPYTQDQVAELLQTDQKSVSAWENDSNLRTRNLERMLSLYKATLSDLAELVDNRDRTTPSTPEGRGNEMRESVLNEVLAALKRAGIVDPEKEGTAAHSGDSMRYGRLA
jgi:transcriptional regulator with XRE-family HTH domain